MIAADLVPHGPYSLRLSGGLASDATRVVANGSYRATIRVEGTLETVRAWQRSDGVVCVRAESEAAVEHVRYVLGLEDDHSEFLRRFAADPLLGGPIRHLRGLRPVRTATVAHALLRAVAGQLILAKRAREIERLIVRRSTPASLSARTPTTPSLRCHARTVSSIPSTRIVARYEPFPTTRVASLASRPDSRSEYGPRGTRSAAITARL